MSSSSASKASPKSAISSAPQITVSCPYASSTHTSVSTQDHTHTHTHTDTHTHTSVTMQEQTHTQCLHCALARVSKLRGHHHRRHTSRTGTLRRHRKRKYKVRSSMEPVANYKNSLL